jgi:hypothetical protein
VDARDISAFARVFDALCAGMTVERWERGRRDIGTLGFRRGRVQDRVVIV